MDRSQTGKNLKKIRQARKMSLDKLAKTLNSSISTIAKHEKEGISTTDYLLRYCEALGCEPSDLLADTVDPEKYSLEEDITSFYPWNLAYEVMVGNGVPTKSADAACNAVYRVYVPALQEAIAELTDREQKVLEMRYKHGMLLEQCGYRLGVTRERIRQVEAKAIRKLRHPRFRKHYLLDTLNKAFEINAEKDRLERENNQLVARLNALGDKIAGEKKAQELQIDIDELELSVRSYNCLKRAGINTLEDLSHMTIDNLMLVRNLGKRSMCEVVDKAKEYGVIIKYKESDK